MAEHAAHLTSATDVDRPSIFEVLAQDSLSVTIRPAGKHGVRVLAETHPERFGWLLRWYDELYTFLDFVIQHHYISHHSASFAENFYDLKRVPSGANCTEQLSRKLKWRSLFVLVLVPYLKHKLDQVFEELKYKEDALPQGPNAAVHVKLSRAYLALYPYVHMVWEGTALMHMLAYTFQRYCWHSLLLHLSGTELWHVTGDENDMHIQKAWSDAGTESWLKSLSTQTLHGVATALSSGLSVGVFFLQFLDWWYNSDASAPELTSLPTPSPPQAADSHMCTVTFPSHSSLDFSIKIKTNDTGSCRDSTQTSTPYTCPLCGRLRTNETALSVSGYVFCFPCIYEYIRKHSCCPVTNYPARTEHLIKIYQANS